MNDNMALVGILCHGVAYAFLYTAAYMYGDKIAPKEMKASVQALIAFLLLGVAQTLSGVAVDEMKDRFEFKEAPATVKTADFSLISVAYAQDGSIAEVAQDAQEGRDDVLPQEFDRNQREQGVSAAPPDCP